MPKQPTKPRDEIESAKELLDPQRYADFLKCLELANIFLKDAKLTVFRHLMEGENSYSFQENASLQQHTDDGAVVEVTYSLTAKSGRRKLAVIKAKYYAIFTMSEKIPAEFFTLYNEYSLPLQTYPYFREYVNGAFSRMGLPSLTLPLRKFLLGDNRQTKPSR